MLDIKELSKAVRQVAEEKGLEPEKIFDVIESSIAAAYKKEYGERGDVIKCKLDEKTGGLKFWQVKTVVDDTMVRFVEETPEEAAERERQEKQFKQSTRDERPDDRRPSRAAGAIAGGAATGEVAEGEEPKLPRFNPERHITLDEASKVKKDAALGDELEFELTPHDDFGRIAAQTAKQVILQKLRESERDSILTEWRGKEGQIVSGAVQRFERGNVFIDLGRAVGVMFTNESIPGEHYRAGERLRFLVLAVQEDTRLPGIILSRSHPKFVAELFKMEVPELAEGAVEIKSIAREPGNRTKIAVAASTESVDPVGALVGQRGTRVMAVNNELGNEKIDIIEWSDDPAKLIANSLSPAKVEKVDVFERREARAFVPEAQLSLAIGRGGQNVRLAAKLTGWKIDVRSQAHPEEMQEGGVAGMTEAGGGMVDMGGEEGTGQIDVQNSGEDKEDVAF